MTKGTRPPATGASRWKRRLRRIAIVLLVIAVPTGFLGWYKLFRDLPQPAWITEDDEKNFMYGSIGTEAQAGIPYWIVLVLPRIFGEYLPGPGGYASLGLPWEEGRELPSGFTKKTIGFDRVGFNCALCHTTQYRLTENERPRIVVPGGSHTSDIQGLIEFFGRSAADPRFNADTILTEIDRTYRLSPTDRLLYRYLFIPMAKTQLMELGQDYDWVLRRPRWGPGRDAPFNLTKFVLLKEPDDGSVDNTDFPSIWHLEAREQPGRMWPDTDFDPWTADFSKVPVDQSRLMLMSLAGDTTSFRSVAIDAALGLRATNTPFFRHRMETLVEWLRKVPAPKYPLPATDADRAAASPGEALFEQHCATCHASGRDNRMGTVIPVEEVGTDPDRTHAWTRQAADGINRIVVGFGIRRTPMSKPPKPGYTAMHMDGLWLRGPYLHNGSVPTLRALLEPAACRPRVFYRGYDVIDQEYVGFVSTRCGEPAPAPPAGCSPVPVQSGCMPPEQGWRYDVSERGNGSGGHAYGTTLSEADKKALVAFLKTL